MTISENVKKYFWTGGGIGIAMSVALLGGKYLAAQEAEKVVAPVQAEVDAVQAEQMTTSKMISDMQFEKRYDESQEQFMACLDGNPRDYCDEEDAWRWEVHYPYLDCIAGLEYAQRGDVCGPVPIFEPLEEVDP